MTLGVPLAGLTAAPLLALALVHFLPRFDARDAIGLAVALVLAAVGLANASAAVFLSVLATLFSAGLRRFFPALAPASDVLAITPFIVMLPLGLLAFRERQVPRTVVLALLVFGGTAARSPGSGLPALVNLAVPIVAGLSIRSSTQRQRLFVNSWLVGSVAAFGYGLVQYFATPSWDEQWLINANFLSAGVPGTPDFRPFATFPSPGTAAFLAVVTLLMAAFALRAWRVPLALRIAAIGVTLPFIVISGVRSAWLFGGAALVIGLVTGLNRRAAVPAIAALAASAAVVTQIPAFTSTFSLRAQTFGTLSTDSSVQARSALLSSAGDYISLLGQGLGTASNASRTGLGGLDNGYIVVLAESGLIGVVALGFLLYGLLRHTSLRSATFVTFWLLANLAGYNFGNLIAFVIVACLVVPEASNVPERSREYAELSTR